MLDLNFKFLSCTKGKSIHVLMLKCVDLFRAKTIIAFIYHSYNLFHQVHFKPFLY